MQEDSTLSEAECIQQVRMGNDHSFAVLIEQYLPMLRQEISRVRINESDKDDLFQEACLGLLAAAKAYREDRGASFATFARLCVRRRLLNAVQSITSVHTSCEQHDFIDEIDNQLQSVCQDPTEWVLHKEEESALLDRLQTILSELEYRVLILHVAAYSYEEIAASLHVSAKAVDNALQRVRNKLKRTL